MHVLAPPEATMSLGFEPRDIIADTGHPHFPYWQAIAAAAIVAAALQAITPDLGPVRLPRAAKVERILQKGGRP